MSRVKDIRTRDGVAVQCIQFVAGGKARAYMQWHGDWVRMEMRQRTFAEYPESKDQWNAFCADAAAVFGGAQ